MMRNILLLMFAIGSAVVGYHLRQPTVVDHYVTQETIRHDCRVAILAQSIPQSALGR